MGGDLVNHALKSFLDPMFRLWSPLFLLRAGMAASALPYPTGEPAVRVSGPDPDRLLIVGGGIAMGFGVLSHELGIAGHLARQIAASTGRGTDVDILAQPELTMSSVPEKLSGWTLSGYDAIILILGVTDSVKRTPSRRWRDAVAGAIDGVRDRAAAGTHVFVVGVQPVRLLPTMDNHIGLFAELHGRALNRESARICAGTEHATFLPFAPQPGSADRYRSSETYGRWARQLSAPITEVLERNHPLGDFII